MAITRAAALGVGWQFWDWYSVQFGVSGNGVTLNSRGVNIQNTGYGFSTATKAEMSCP